MVACLLLVAILQISTGCRKFLDVGNPRTQVAIGNVFSENQTAIAALTVIYAQMSSMKDISQFTGLSADEFTNYGGPLYTNIYQNTLVEGNAENLLWSSSYNYIYQANAVMDGLQQSTAVSDDVKKQLLGEAKFIRAFWLFYMVNLYGDVPITTSIDYNINRTIARSPQQDVYRQIINDLKDAQQLLSDNYVDSKNAVTTDRVRPTQWAATSLLARVYLYTRDYPDAEAQSSLVISNQAMFGLTDSLNDVFLKNSKEAIWQLMPSPVTGYNTDEGHAFILTSIPNSNNGVALNPLLLNAFEPGDQRKNKWIDSITVSGTTYFFPYKYKINTGSDIQEYSMVLRLAEQYLIRAEARIQQQKLADGTSDLDKIRHRSGLSGTTAQTQQSLLTAIQHERQVEFFTEGHRWLDLKNRNLVDATMRIVTPLKGGGTWQSYQQYYPLPSGDIRNNKNIKQNTGY